MILQLGVCFQPTLVVFGSAGGNNAVLFDQGAAGRDMLQSLARCGMTRSLHLAVVRPSQGRRSVPRPLPGR